MKNSRSSYKRFTLIELLVVVAIIGILASLLIPSLAKGRKISRIAVCTSNQKQINLALLMFTDDNDGYVPKPSAQLSWDDQLSGYDGRPTLTGAQKTPNNLPKADFEDDYGQLYRCPLYKETATATYVEMSYAISQFKAPEPDTQWYTGQGIMNNYGYAAKLSDVTVPSESIMLFDYNRTSNDTRMGRNVDNIVRATDLEKWETLQSDGMMHGFYDVNYLFVDGHVQSINFYATVIPYNATAFKSNGSMWDAYK